MHASENSTTPLSAKKEFVRAKLYPELKLRKFKDRVIL